MSHHPRAWVRRIVGVTALGFVVAGAGAGTAHAENLAPDLPVTVEVCDNDLSRTFPSCKPDLRAPARPQISDVLVVKGTDPPDGTALIVGHHWACTDHDNGFTTCKFVIVVCDDDDPGFCTTVPPTAD